MDSKFDQLKVNSIFGINNIHDRNDLLKKNNIYNKYNLKDKRQSSKDKDSLKNKERNIEAQEDAYRFDDKVDIDFLKVIQNNQEKMELQYIACKIACGDNTSKEEIEIIKNKNSDLLRKAILIGNKRKKLEERLKIVKNNQEAQVLIFRTRNLVVTSMPNVNNKLEDTTIKVVMMSAIDRAEHKYRTNSWFKDDIELEINLIEAELV